MGTHQLPIRIALIGTGYWASIVFNVLESHFRKNIDRFTSKSLKFNSESKIYNWSSRDLEYYSHYFVCCGPVHQGNYINDIVQFGKKDSLVWVEKPLLVSLEKTHLDNLKVLEMGQRLFINQLYTRLNVSDDMLRLSSELLESDVLTIRICSKRQYMRPHRASLDFLPHHITILHLICQSANIELTYETNILNIQNKYRVISSAIDETCGSCELHISGIRPIVRFEYKFDSHNESLISFRRAGHISEFSIPLCLLFSRPLDRNINFFITNYFNLTSSPCNTSVDYQIYVYLLSCYALGL